jgi:signal transduction histidine kinase
VEGSIGRDGDVAVIRVRDTGRGIAQAEQGKIFNKFYRGSTVLTDAIPGVGLGLAITKTIVDAHGGSITVSSELGQGATFEVRLPLAEPPLVPAV